jgi:hypothetical protein
MKQLPLKKDCLALSLLIAMVLWFGGEMVWGDKAPFFRDLGTYFYPMRFSLAQSFKLGELPLWDRHVAMGYPLLADFQSGAFYPPNVLYLILPFFTAIRATFVLHYLIAAIGAYLLCRNWGYPLFLALIGAVLFTLGGTIISLTNLMNHFQAAVWLPWAVLLARRFLHEQSWKNFLLLTLTLLLQFLAGSPEIYLISQALLLIYGLRMSMTEPGVRARNIFFTLLGANVVVAGLAMVQIMPTLELIADSRARQPVSFNEASSWSLRPVSLLNLFFIDKEIDIEKFTAPKLFFSRQTPFLLSYYMGAIVPIGLLLWLYYSAWKEKIAVFGLVVLSLLTAMGSYTPFYFFLFSYVPFFKFFRFPEKFFFFTYAVLLFIALRGLSGFLRSDKRWNRALFMPSSFCLLAAVFYLCLRLDIASFSEFISRVIQPAANMADSNAKFPLFLVHLEMQIALSSALLFLLFLGKKGKLRASLFNVLLVGLVFVDLSSAHRSYQFLLSPDVVYKSPKILSTPDIEPNRLFYSPGFADVHPIYYVLPKEPPFAEFNSLVFSNLLPNTGVFFGFDYMQELDALGRWPYLTFLGVARKLERPRLYHLLSSLNVQYINSISALSEEGIKLVHGAPDRHSWLYKVDRSVPRVYVVPRAIEEKDPEKILQQLSSPKFDPMNEVLLEETFPLPVGRELHATANIKSYENQVVKIDAALDAPGILVLADSFYPGWRAYVNGKEEKIVRANLFFRAVYLPPGKHRVEFRYKPRSFTVGLIASIMTLCGVAGWSFILFIRNREWSRSEKKRTQRVA